MFVEVVNEKMRSRRRADLEYEMWRLFVKVRGSTRQKRDREPAAISALTARTPLPKWMAVSDAWIAWRLSAKSSSACAWNGRNK